MGRKFIGKKILDNVTASVNDGECLILLDNTVPFTISFHDVERYGREITHDCRNIKSMQYGIRLTSEKSEKRKKTLAIDI